MDLLLSEAFLSPIIISLKVALTATALSLCIGLLLLYLMEQSFPGKSVIETIIMLPMVLPPTVIGFLLLFLFGRQGLGHLLGVSPIFTIYAAIMAATVVAVPLMYQSLKIGIDNVTSDVIDAAKVDGADGMHIFRYIIIPLAKNALLTGLLFSFARALGEFGATLIFAGNIPGLTQTMATAIYIAIDNNELKLASAWVILMIVFSFILMLLIQNFKKNT
ncbi:putative molybdenum transport system permease protein YvgM [Macrococcus hajekii]|uniref:molybdate ABC transporter permease subunit n=1 Tax=Macrococcus hajekii TaxID=198482 RepID=UPI00166AFD3E|nr:molybdate ABC transporter permease subunit [Macrococcus hajekii]GGB08521.1 putative molybdenum transport system permease protein YvgM [Macrococcus hajekii]